MCVYNSEVLQVNSSWLGDDRDDDRNVLGSHYLLSNTYVSVDDTLVSVGQGFVIQAHWLLPFTTFFSNAT